jgi:HKD family nuclease
MTDTLKLLLNPQSGNGLSTQYRKAFEKAVELFIVTAYLTDWDSSLKLNPACLSFRVIIGKDFGITRKAACEAVMKWLPPERKGQFLVADQIGGFHPKAIFWKEANGRCFAIIGSSNLTKAAFETNYEANMYSELSLDDYAKGKEWVKQIEGQCLIVAEGWLKKYNEAPYSWPSGDRVSNKRKKVANPVVTLKLPAPLGMPELIEERRKDLIAFEKNKAKLMELFLRCASGQISSPQFYKELPKYWSFKTGDRMQGAGWERKGKGDNLSDLSQSIVRISDATKELRDDTVVEEIDRLAKRRVVSRGAFLSEMLCLRFPAEYPLLDKPVQNYLNKMDYKAPRGATEGVRYLHLAKTLRESLRRAPEHPAKNLAELDTVIWLAFGKKRSGKL